MDVMFCLVDITGRGLISDEMTSFKAFRDDGSGDVTLTIVEAFATLCSFVLYRSCFRFERLQATLEISFFLRPRCVSGKLCSNPAVKFGIMSHHVS